MALKNTLLLLTLPFFVLVSSTSIAQNNILAGKITDENNIPMPNAIIQLQNDNKQIVVAKTNDKGLYYTQQLSPGEYNVTILSNGKENIGEKINIMPEEKGKRYYNFILKSHKIGVGITTKDPFIKENLAEIRKQDLRKIYIFDAE